MERRQRIRFWVQAGKCSGATLCDAGWRHRLGDLYPAFKRHLEDTGSPAEVHPPLYRGEPDYGLKRCADGTYKIDPHSGAHDSGDAPRHRSGKEDELFARRFAPEEVLGKRLSVVRLLGDACEPLGIMPGIQRCGEHFYRLGTRARKTVFLQGVKALFASNEQAKAFFDAAVEAEGQGINGTGRYRLKI